MTPYRTQLARYEKPHRPNFVIRLWYRFVGKLVYGGKETCGHCKYWTEPEEACEWISGEWAPNKGDCKLLYGEKDTVHTEGCCRFTPARRYMHREKISL